MQAQLSPTGFSWQQANDPTVLSEVFAPEHSVVVWERQKNELIEHYFMEQYSSLGIRLREVFNIQSLKAGLRDVLPDANGKELLIEDIYLLSDMLTCLFDCEQVGVRLTPMEQAMCPRFHADNIPVRLVCTYVGNGTQWIPNERVGDLEQNVADSKRHQPLAKRQWHKDDIQQMNAFDVALLKGSAWGHSDHFGAIHRSCPMEAGEQRVLLTLDPM
ncbi:DUF1826 domain-containing protein [Alteromonadaceae bacterium M269]|nr:DUF1826 domain-containing protein [Alteromonadaceae bacterium M269]